MRRFYEGWVHWCYLPDVGVCGCLADSEDDTMARRQRSAAQLSAQERFFIRLKTRLDAGARKYGDRSFDRPCRDIIDEMQQEAEDIAGWGYILWSRLDALRARSDRAESAQRP